MSIASRMAIYELSRSSTTTDAYGIMSATPTKVTDIKVSITKYQPAHDSNIPSYDITSHMGITEYIGVQVGDLITGGSHTYQVKDIGNRGTRYQPLFLEMLNEDNN